VVEMVFVYTGFSTLDMSKALIPPSSAAYR
jgi:hypothetical protein